MIISGELKEGKLTLRAESTQDATMIRSGLSGKNTFVNIAPYGNRIEITLMGNGIVFRKNNDTPLTYEELKSIVKKIQMFGKIDSFQAKRVLKDAREELNRQLTLFFKTVMTPQLEMGFAYNWISLEFKHDALDEIFNEIKALITETCPPTIRVFSNNSDAISIHNYAMTGIFLGRDSYEGIVAILVRHGILLQDDSEIFVRRASAFAVKSVSFMEARQASDQADEDFSISHLENYELNVGDIQFIKKMLEITEKLSETGEFSSLDAEYLHELYKIASEDNYIAHFNLSDTLLACFSGIARNFSDEIQSINVG